jgi:hypothetical protein
MTEHGQVRHPLFEQNVPVKPYGGAARTGGGAGSATSKGRAAREAANGTLTRRQAEMMALITEAGAFGMTWREISAKTGLHHGQVSGPLSNLHRGGLLAALSEDEPGGVRNNCGVYILADLAAGRLTRPFKPIVANRRPHLTDAERAMLNRFEIALEAQPDGTIVRVRPDSFRAMVQALRRLDGDPE